MEDFKFSTLEYRRPDLDQLKKQLAEWKAAVENAGSYE